MIASNPINTPTKLTLIRLLVSPIVLPFLFYWLLPLDNLIINGFLVLLFIALSLTDFFDGYLARRFHQETNVGKSLDHIADKFLVCTALISLLAVQKIFFYWVIILLVRELFVMGLRLIALEHRVVVPVSFFGKLKTACQMIMLTIIIVNPYQKLGLRGAPHWCITELVVIAITIGISLLSAYFYYQSFIKAYGHMVHVRNQHNNDLFDR